MATKLKLNPAPTFTATVMVPVPGEEAAPVKFTFKHRKREDMESFVEQRAGKKDSESVLDMATGWDLQEPFTPENVELLCDNYMGAALAVYRKYVDELVKVREGN